jgi:hypothetical protein
MVVSVCFRDVARALLLAAAVALPALLADTAWAQDAARPVVRCPGPPVLYTDTLTAQEARDKGCRTIEGAPITVMQAAPRARPASSAQRVSGEGRVDAAAQRSRDSDARRILGDELQREEERLAALKQDYNGGEPERRGDERNYQRYLDRVAELKAAILRKETDIAALRRELAKLPQ